LSKRNLVICDSEFPYVHYLMENILEKKDPTVHVFVCTSWDKVVDLMKTMPIHILLLDESYLAISENALSDVEQTVVLTHTKGTEQILSYQAIYKYQHIDRILAAIFEDTETFYCKKANGPRIIAVYSPIGRCGKTSFAIALGKELAKDSKTLYLHLDAYPGQEMFEREEDTFNLGDMLYYLKQEHTNPGLRLSAMVLRDEWLDFLMPIPMNADLKEVTEDEWEQLLDWLVKDGPYENILLKVGESVQGLFKILERCDKIYMPIVRDEISERKLACYKKNLTMMNLSELEKRTTRIVIPENESVDVVRILMKGRL